MKQVIFKGKAITQAEATLKLDSLRRELSNTENKIAELENEIEALSEQTASSHYDNNIPSELYWAGYRLFSNKNKGIIELRNGQQEVIKTWHNEPSLTDLFESLPIQ